jgi:triacylglycerol lipase
MITDKNFAEQSALFAQLSAFGYKEPKDGIKLFKKLGYFATFISNKDAEAYIVEDESDFIIVCRGTQPNQWSDISADLSIDRVKPHNGGGKVHVGFKSYADKLWEPIVTAVVGAKVARKKIWVTGHSLGAAMATLIARRCALEPKLQTPRALFTYGSPRVGDKTYVEELDKLVPHHRWVNDGDIVTKVPPPPFYSHCGTMHHIDGNGIVTPEMEKKKKLKTIIRLVVGFWGGLLSKIMGDTKDHSIEVYAQRLAYWSLNSTEE